MLVTSNGDWIYVNHCDQTTQGLHMPRFSSASDLQTFLTTNAKGMARDILDQAAESRIERSSARAGLHREIQERWPEGLKAIDAAIFAMSQDGYLMLKRLDEVDESTPGDPHQSVRIVLTLLHSSGTITLHEIRTLIEAGFWVGGAARWRALHETAVTAKLVAQGEEPIAQRYLDHAYVVQTRRLKTYFDRHGAGPVSAKELDERAAVAQGLEQAHALDDSTYRFRDSYGWAVPLMPLSRKGVRVPPTLDALEKLAELDHRRLLVASSHGAVHGDAAGVCTSVLLEDGDWLLGPTERFIETVARPTFDTLIHLVGATHLGFEPEINDFAETISLCGAGLMSLCGEAIELFERTQG